MRGTPSVITSGGDQIFRQPFVLRLRMNSAASIKVGVALSHTYWRHVPDLAHVERPAAFGIARDEAFDYRRLPPNVTHDLFLAFTEVAVHRAVKQCVIKREPKDPPAGKRVDSPLHPAKRGHEHGHRGQCLLNDAVVVG